MISRGGREIHDKHSSCRQNEGEKLALLENLGRGEWSRSRETLEQSGGLVVHSTGEGQSRELLASAHEPLVHVITFFGVPNTWQILKIVSISLAPGKRGRRVYTSAMMQPTAQTSMGEL